MPTACDTAVVLHVLQLIQVLVASGYPLQFITETVCQFNLSSKLSAPAYHELRMLLSDVVTGFLMTIQHEHYCDVSEKKPVAASANMLLLLPS